VTETCESTHPENDAVRCTKSPHPFGSHYCYDTGQVWPGVPMPEKRTHSKREPKGKRVSDVITSIEDSGRGLRTGSPALHLAPAATMERTWRQTQEQWIREAKEALHQVCLANETFTTELVWALVDSPKERRAMVVVVRHGIRAGWMHEDHAKRIHGVWTTRDGHEFPLNKLVPVYRSDLHNQA
jgi:hypothetical protein